MQPAQDGGVMPGEFLLDRIAKRAAAGLAPPTLEQPLDLQSFRFERSREAAGSTPAIASLSGRKQVVAEARNAQLLYAEVKRGSLHPQARRRAGRAGHHPAGLLENLQNVVPLDVLQSCWSLRCSAGGRF
jgi:hypothetical protein